MEATTKRTERWPRGPALERKAGRTRKSAAGAHRRRILVSVLESLWRACKGACPQRLLGEPLRGWRHVRVSARRTRKDYALCVRALVDVPYPQANKLRLVQDNQAKAKGKRQKAKKVRLLPFAFGMAVGQLREKRV